MDKARARARVIGETDRAERLGPGAYDVANVLEVGQMVDVYEIDGQWARTSRYYDAGLHPSMTTSYIVNGNVARWMMVAHLDIEHVYDGFMMVKDTG